MGCKTAAQMIYCTLFCEVLQVNQLANRPASSPIVAPLPPANSVPQSVRALNTILEQISGPAALKALRDGDVCANVDLALWGPAWEGARNFRDHFILSLARTTRDEWRRDVAEVVATQPEFNHALKVNQALDARLRITFEFAFRLLTPRHVCLLADGLSLAFEADIPPNDFGREVANSASRARHATPQLLEAVILGGSGMHRYQPERLLASNPSGNGGFSG